MVSVKHRLIALTMSLMMFSLALPAAAEDLDSAILNERPGEFAMIGDAIFVRPLLAASTVLGAGIFVVTLPFSLLGGNVGEVAKTMVVAPFKATFLRCMGCTPAQDEWNAANTVDASAK
jgi:hypothetical protein